MSGISRPCPGCGLPVAVLHPSAVPDGAGRHWHSGCARAALARIETSERAERAGAVPFDVTPKERRP